MIQDSKTWLCMDFKSKTLDIEAVYLKPKKSLATTNHKNVPYPLLLPILPSLYKKKMCVPIFNLIQSSHMIPQLQLPCFSVQLPQGRRGSSNNGWAMGACGWCHRSRNLEPISTLPYTELKDHIWLDQSRLKIGKYADIYRTNMRSGGENIFKHMKRYPREGR